MTWSLSIGAANKAAAKREVTRKLPAAMLHQEPHVRDFDLVKATLNGAIDTVEEGTISVSASGHVGYNGQGDDTKISEVNMQLRVSSTPPAVVVEQP